MDEDALSSLEILQELDDSTDWEFPPELTGEGDNPSSSLLDEETSIEDIVDVLQGFDENNNIESVVLIINTPEGDQFLVTNLARNDLILGCLTTAAMNWHRSQCEAQSCSSCSGEEGEEEELV